MKTKHDGLQGQNESESRNGATTGYVGPDLTKHVRGVLRSELPAHAFGPSPTTVVYTLAQVAVLLSAYWGMAHTEASWALIPLGLLAGHCLFCIGTTAHSLSHGAGIRNRKLRYFVELLLWTPGFVSTTAWVALHNKSHHGNVNTTEDIFLYRYFTPRERTFGRYVYSLLCYPNKYLPWNPLVLLPLIPFTLFPVLHGLLGIPMVQSPERQYQYMFGARGRARIAVELSLMVGFQFLLAHVIGPEKWLYSGVIPTLTGAAIAMWYINTQHHIHPLRAQDDALNSSTNVIVPNFVRILHANFNFHIEHHLYPSMDPAFYPLVSAQLKARWPAQYHEVGPIEAYRQMYRNDVLKSVKPLTAGLVSLKNARQL